jgi:solute carrier family 25 citrate transporter 1
MALFRFGCSIASNEPKDSSTESKVVTPTPAATAPKRRLGLDFLAGAIGGAFEVFGTMPLDVVKTQMQVNHNYKSPMKCAASIMRTDGIRGLYFGMPAFLTQTAGKGGIRFYAFEQGKVLLNHCGIDTSKQSMFVDFACGSVAGAAEALVAVFWTTPTERLKVLRQTEMGAGSASKYNTMAGGIATIYKEQGWQGLFVGAGPTALRQATSVGFRFMFYDTVKIGLNKAFSQDPNSNSTSVALISGGLVGGISVALNTPIDVIKSSLQAKNAEYTTSSECIKGIMKKSGITGFFQGMSTRVSRVFLGQAITFAVYERTREVLYATF